MTQRPFIIHGHFYQPPRENPWLETVERQDSAAPWHDWNERVAAECYRPMAWSRVYGPQGTIVRAVNNYQWISFNAGPTLLSWLGRHMPWVVQRVLSADRLSAQRLGHGNALAQSYAHSILPLDTPRDRLTQVRWGLADFRARFGREPEALWLPETACDMTTLRVLAGEGLRFALLAPRQAARVRPLADPAGPWTNVRDGSLETGRAYRCFLSDDRGQWIDLFFYDGGLAHQSSFGTLLEESHRLMEGLRGSAKSRPADAPLVHMALDGETFGHHKPYADRVLAHLMTEAAPNGGFQPVNYGWFLEHHPPRWEVELAAGPQGLGTSWSCAHGVARWKADCGCHTGGGQGWHQRWREPLREALDALRDQGAKLFEREAGRWLADPWAARDDYGRLLAEMETSPRQEQARAEFLSRHGRGKWGQEEGIQVFSWLEQQRHSLRMYASCAWFFSDPAGIETVQALRHAARSVQMIRQQTGQDLEAELTRRLERVPGNLPEFPHGEVIYRRLALPARAGAGRAALHLALAAVERRRGEDASPQKFHGWRGSLPVGPAGLAGRAGKTTVFQGQGWVEEILTGRRWNLNWVLLRRGPESFRFYLGPEGGPPPALRGNLKALLAACRAWSGRGPLTPRHLTADRRMARLERVQAWGRSRLALTAARLYRMGRPLLPLWRRGRGEIPSVFKETARLTLNERLVRLVFHPPSGPHTERRSAAHTAVELLNAAMAAGVMLDWNERKRDLERETARRVEALGRPNHWRELPFCHALLDTAQALGLNPDLLAAQDALLAVKARMEDGQTDPPPANWSGEWKRLAARLGVELEAPNGTN
ncbi:MAG: DUF3536 domain-containing protein [Deltaproteobacteria bacterium]|nr:DUF3536 domain-containing protein [Deltaproteobacteria bacterium]